MSGGKKNKAAAVPAEPAALPGPTLNVPPTPQPVSGHLDLLAQQLHQGFPSLGQADLLRNMQSTYKPVAGSGTATAAASRAPMATGQRSVALPGDRGYSGGMINTPGELASLIMEARRRKTGG